MVYRAPGVFLSFAADGAAMLAFRPLIGIIVGVAIALIITTIGLIVALRCRRAGLSKHKRE